MITLTLPSGREIDINEDVFDRIIEAAARGLASKPENKRSVYEKVALKVVDDILIHLTFKDA